MFKFSFTQFDILVDRYMNIWSHDLGNLLLLLLQAPVIALCIVLVWRDIDQPTDTMYFVMNLSAIWFGAINASREIVKEKLIFKRESALGLENGSYILSKFAVLSALGLLQCLILAVFVNFFVHMPGSIIWHLIFMSGASLAGTALGLAISAFSASPDRAVALVPILLLPQILFSDEVLPSRYASLLTKYLKNSTITQWACEANRQVAAAEPNMNILFTNLAVLALMIVLLLLLTDLFLNFNK